MPLNGIAIDDIWIYPTNFTQISFVLTPPRNERYEVSKIHIRGRLAPSSDIFLKQSCRHNCCYNIELSIRLDLVDFVIPHELTFRHSEGIDRITHTHLLPKYFKRIDIKLRKLICERMNELNARSSYHAIMTAGLRVEHYAT